MEDIENLRKQLPLWLAELDIDIPFPLHDCQVKALAKIMDDKGILAVIPTGMGKTLMAVFASKYSSLIKNKKSLLMAPLRSLTTEHVETYADYGIKALLDNGKYPKQTRDYNSTEYDVVISTYEKMDAIIRNYNDMSQVQKRDVIFNKFDTIIIDEVHSVEDDSRGVNLESFIMSVKYLFPHIKIVGLSATIGNHEYFGKWLGSDVIYEPPEKRPVTLDVNVILIYAYLNRDQLAEKMGNLLEEIRLNPKAKRMVAVTAVDRTIQTVHLLNDVQRNRNNEYKVQFFMKQYGMAWHYSGSRGMSEDDRMAVEWAFQYEDLPDDDEYYYEEMDEVINRKLWLRENYGITKGINIIVCTPTLITGRNLPVTYINVFDHVQFTYKGGAEIIKANRLQQTIGRAGRLKFAKGNPNYKGVANIYVQQRDEYEIYDRLKPFDVESHLSEHLGEKILAWINSKIVKTEEDIYKFLGNALDPSIKNNTRLIKEEIAYLRKYKFINGGGNELSVTPKGLKTIRYYIQPRTVVRWGAMIAKYINMKPEDIVLEQFMVEAMDVDEYLQGVITDRRDEQIIRLMHQKLDYVDVDPGAIKSFIFCFPSYSRKVMEINEEDYIIPRSESKSLRKQFERMISALSEIYGYTTLRTVLTTSRYMVKAGVFNRNLAELMSLNGIGEIYAKRLLKYKVDSKQKLMEMYNNDRRRLLSIMSIPSKKLKTIMEKNI